MFYLKTKLANGKVIKTEITDENVFTRCPDCGRECRSILWRFSLTAKVTSFPQASSALPAPRNAPKSVDTMAASKLRSTVSLCFRTCSVRRAISAQVQDLFDEYEIEAVQELAPEQFEPFADALKALPAEGGGL